MEQAQNFSKSRKKTCSTVMIHFMGNFKLNIFELIAVWEFFTQGCVEKVGPGHDDGGGCLNYGPTPSGYSRWTGMLGRGRVHLSAAASGGTNVQWVLVLSVSTYSSSGSRAFSCCAIVTELFLALVTLTIWVVAVLIRFQNTIICFTLLSFSVWCLVFYSPMTPPLLFLSNLYSFS